MEIWLASWLASTLIILAISCLKVFICLTYRRQGADDRLTVDVYTLRKLVSYHLEVPLVRIARRGGLPWPETVVDTPGGQTETHAHAEQRYVRTAWRIFRRHPRRWQRLMRQFRYYVRLYNQAAARIFTVLVCEKIVWRTVVGTGDAALTAIAIGALWQFKGLVYAAMKRRLKRVPRPDFKVQPHYAGEGVDIELECIFSMRLGNVINALATGSQFWGKGGDSQWKSTQSKV